MWSVNRYCVCVPLFVCLVLAIELVVAKDFQPTDNILLDCGGPSSSTDTDGRVWTTDVGSKFDSSSAKSTTVSPAATQDPAVPQVPYMTARVFHAPFTYAFPVASGWKFLRLHFYPASYSNLNASDARFAVTANSYTLLRNFSVAQTTLALNYAYILKEFAIYVEGKTLNVTFTPSTNASNAYAFVNGIEVVSMPDIYTSTDGTTMIVGTNTAYTIDNSTALENVYRLNVGGNDISPSHDTGMFRSWSDDVPFLFGAAFGVTEPADPDVKFEYPPGTPSYIAPLDVYTTARSMGPNPKINTNYNLSWIFNIDSGFSYLVRLHFAEVSSNITKNNQRVFDIFLNNQTATQEADVIAWAKEFGLSHSNGVPVHKDYVVFIPEDVEPRQDLWLALHPDPTDKPMESGRDKSHSSPVQDIIDPSTARAHNHGKSKNHTGIIAGGVAGGVVVVLLIGLFAFALSRRQRKDSGASEGPSGWLPLSLYDSKGKKDSDAMGGYDGNVTDSRSSGISMSIGGRSLASEDSDGLTPSAVFSQIMNPKGR
ncbi:hypothetical protein ACSQ67_016191 [Phaseolus vulgaris]